MNYVATITSKRQLTIPVQVFKKMRLTEGEKVLVREENGVIKLESAKAAIRRLAGSVNVPKRFKGMSIDEIIEKAKGEYFAEKHKNIRSR